MEWMRIGEVARRTGLTTRTLRHYDELGLLVPSGRTDTDYRMYTLEDVQRLLAIQHLKSLGLGLAEIAAALDDPGFDPTATLRRHIEAVEDRIAAEQDLLHRLTSLVAAPHEDWDDVLVAIALSERLRHPEAAVRFRATLDAPPTSPRRT
ncbi:MerR family transcriptional regulator [Propioniciclava coleopterorum]|uniref:MerR family transcriptional regulator n=1 Tax=Propioniciclava coleopterorum TaxID=2714937 RepID=A0A6G7Y6S4_9ACTN|nr:MerR family transcriptional regulator [Propioniciclava coleopterorum]QIK72317.1 MerR family transcriptional regulator [Propioniciclava coleopterorum]